MPLHESSAREQYLFGGYEILETTGSGGMGVVYRAVDHALGRIVALKILRDDLRCHPQVVARFRREAEAFASLDHPNIVRIYSVGEVGQIPYIAMEHIQGAPLSEILQARAPLDWREALDIAAQVADALACAHDAQIVHRDIKPGNIIIDENGKAYVTDFGIAKVLTATTQLTQDGARLGTPQYMCPERCQNREITAASDIFSLGVVLFQSISGQLPFKAESPVALIRIIADEPAPRLRQRMPAAPESVERLIAFMLEKDPAHRPKSARALRVAIDRVRQGKPLDAQADEMSHALAAFRRSLPASKEAEQDAGGPGLFERVRRAWFGLSRGLRIVLAFALLGLTATILALPLLPLAGGPGIPQLAYGPDHGVQRWYASAPVVSFQSETPRVFLARLNFPDFSVSRVLWAGEAAWVQLEGKASGPRNAQRALCRVDPLQRQAAVAIPPVFTGQGGAFVALGGGAGGYGIATPAGAFLESSTGLRERRMIADLHVGALALDPAGKGVALAYTTGADSDWVVAEAALDALYKKTQCTPAGSPVCAVAYSPDGRWLAYVRQEPEGRSVLWVLSEYTKGQSGRRLIEGRLHLGSRPFDAMSETVAVAVTDEDGETVVRRIGVEDGRVLGDLGPGQYPAWHPANPNCLVLTAPDRAGRTQLWAVEDGTTPQRTQLTHLGTGTLPQAALSEDGHYALAGLPDTAAVVIADLRNR